MHELEFQGYVWPCRFLDPAKTTRARGTLEWSPRVSRGGKPAVPALVPSPASFSPFQLSILPRAPPRVPVLKEYNNARHLREISQNVPHFCTDDIRNEAAGGHLFLWLTAEL